MSRSGGLFVTSQALIKTCMSVFSHFPKPKINLPLKGFMGFFPTGLRAPVLVLTLFAVPFCLLSLLTHWTASELYPGSTARYLFSERSHDFLFSLKPLFNLLLFLSFQVSDWFSLYPLTAARFLFFLNGLSLAFLTWLIIRKKSDSFSAILALLLLISSPIFLERGFRVRSDLLSTTLSLLALALALFFHKKDSSDNELSLFTGPFKDSLSRFLKSVSLPFLVLSSVFFVTPKGAYWFIITGFLLCERRRPPPLGWKIRILPTTSLVLSLFLITGFVFGDPFFLMAVQKSASFYWMSFQDVWILNDPVFRIPDSPISHVLIFIAKNPLLFLIGVLKAAFVFHRIFILKQRSEKFSDISFACLLLVFIFHPFQKPFFIASLQPFFLLAFFSDPLWQKTSKRLASTHFRVFLISLLALSSIVMAGLHLSRTLKTNNNSLQKAALKSLNDFTVNFPQVKIYDPLGLLFKGSAEHWYHRIYEADTAVVKQKIVSHNIDVIYSSPWRDTIAFKHWQQQNIGWVDIGQHIYYRSWQKQLKAKAGKLSGKSLLKAAQSDPALKNRNPKTYWYVFLDSQKNPLPTHKECLRETGKNPKKALFPWCLYTEAEFKARRISYPLPKNAEAIALMYPPRPKNFPKEVFLNSLFRYDIFP